MNEITRLTFVNLSKTKQQQKCTHATEGRTFKVQVQTVDPITLVNIWAIQTVEPTTQVV
jgi:hypothetical protein